MTPSLDEQLASVARADDWATAVLHRCAWCQRIAGTDGVYRKLAILSPTTVITDGMCPTCGQDALARVQQRHRRRAA